MSRRNRRRGSDAVVDVGSQEIERLLAKGRVKDAFKQAKLAFRQQATSENRLLLERTYLLRVQDLLRGGMPSAAAEVARSFLDFGVTEPGMLGELAALLPQLGMIEEARRLAPRLESPDAAAALALSLADQAVLHPERASAPDVKEGAERIRSALAALDGEQENRAIELLQDIPRSSPWADWRYFVRGLAAFRRSDAEHAAANWDRLDPRRAAHRIAKRLQLTMAADARTDQQGAANADLSAIETAVFGQPVLGRLDRLQRLIDRTNPKNDWKQAMSLIASLTATLRRLDRRLAQRLTDVLMPAVFDRAVEVPYEQARELFDDLARSAEPWYLDPHWNRLWALCCEEAAEGAEAAKIWKNYVRDLEQVSELRPEERRRMQALVWRHIGMLLAEDARGDTQPWLEKSGPEESQLRDGASQALAESLRLDPAQRETYDLLISLYQEWEAPDRVAEARRRLLEVFPDDVETLKALAIWHLKKDQPLQSLEYVRRARKLRPLDALLIDDEHTALIGLARHRALERCFDEARATFDQAVALRPEKAKDVYILARRAIFEFKAGEEARAKELIEQARATLPEPAPLWLQLAIEADRYKISSSRRAEFNRELSAALKKRKKGETAARLAELIGSYHGAEVEYHDRERHRQAVTRYIKATSRTRYTQTDLEDVCRFLSVFCPEDQLLNQLACRGLKNFPRSPVFHLLRAEDDLRRLPMHFNFKGISGRLQKALALAQADSEGRYVMLIDPIKRQLSEVERLREATDTMKQGFKAHGGFPGGLPAFFQMMASMGGDDDDENDDADYSPFEDDSFFTPPFAAPRKRGRGRAR